MQDPIAVSASLASAARGISAPDALEQTLAQIAEVAATSLPGVDEVAIHLPSVHGEIMVCASGATVGDLGRLEREAGEGPSTHVRETGEVVRVDDLRHEQRWPSFVGPAAQLGFTALVAVPLDVGRRPFGALVAYSRSVEALKSGSEQSAALFAVHATLAIEHSRRIANLNVALDTRKDIGLALGILMERLSITEDQAFAYLTRQSAATQTKLRVVAAGVVEEAQNRSVPVEGHE